MRARIQKASAGAPWSKSIFWVSRSAMFFLGCWFFFFGNASVLWQHRTLAAVYIQSMNVAAGYRCEVICFQLPVLRRCEASVQLITSAPQPPVFRRHYHNAAESQCCRVITPSSLISLGRPRWRGPRRGGGGFFMFLNSTEINIGGNVSWEAFHLNELCVEIWLSGGPLLQLLRLTWLSSCWIGISLDLW